MEWEKGHYSLINQNGLAEYSGRPGARVRLLKAGRMGDGFIHKNGENFHVTLDWMDLSLDKPYLLKPGDIIGIEEEGILGFSFREFYWTRDEDSPSA